MKVHLPDGRKRSESPPAPKRRGLIRCPQCNSHRLSHEMAFIGGAKYYCADCGFRGALVISSPDEPADGRRDGA